MVKKVNNNETRKNWQLADDIVGQLVGDSILKYPDDIFAVTAYVEEILNKANATFDASKCGGDTYEATRAEYNKWKDEDEDEWDY